MTVPIVGRCPAHGEQFFVRNEACAWWECPHYGHSAGAFVCQSVVPDEDVTPDGGRVTQWATWGRLVQDVDPPSVP